MMDPNEALTSQQLEFIALYASGYDMKAIADMKFFTVSGVTKSLAAARERTGAKTLAHLCVMAHAAGVIRRIGTGFEPVQEERVA